MNDEQCNLCNGTKKIIRSYQEKCTTCNGIGINYFNYFIGSIGLIQYRCSRCAGTGTISIDNIYNCDLCYYINDSEDTNVQDKIPRSDWNPGYSPGCYNIHSFL